MLLDRKFPTSTLAGLGKRAARGGARRAALPAKPIKAEHGLKLLAYLKAKEPRAWAEIVRRVPQAEIAVNKAGAGMAGLAQDDLVTEPPAEGGGIDWQGIINKAVTAGSGALQLIQNQNLFKANLQRAQAGKPPLTPEQTAAMVQPVRAAATVGLDTSTRNMVTLIAVGAGVLVLGGFGILAFARRGPSHPLRNL